MSRLLALLLLLALPLPALAAKKAPLTPAEKHRALLMQGGASEPPPEGGPVELVLKKVIKVDRWPKGVELTPDQKHALVTNFSDNTLSLIDTTTLQVVRKIRTGKDSPVETAYNKDGSQAVITGGWQRSDVLLYDLASGTVAARISGKLDGPAAQRRVFPKVAAFSPDFSRFYVSYWTSDNVAVFDAATNGLLGLVPTGVNPRGIAITPDGKKGYVANFDTRGCTVTVFQADAAPFKVLKTVGPLPNPRHVLVSPDGRFAYVSLFGKTGGVAKIDTGTDEIVARSVGTGKRGKTLKISPDGRWLFLVNFGADTVSVFEAETLKEVARYPTGDEPCGLDVSRDGKTLWTTDWNDDQVRIWDIVVRASGPAAVPAAVPAPDPGATLAAPAAPASPTAPPAAAVPSP